MVTPLAEMDIVRVVFELSDAPASSPHALTFTLDQSGATLTSGDHLAADLVVALGYRDAELLTEGGLEGSQLLREGRLKVRGDVNAIVPFGTWMVAAQNATVADDQHETNS